MKKYRLNTTISDKHHSILKKHTEKLGTQRRVLENALESLENNSNPEQKLSPEEEIWMRIGREIKDVQMLNQREFIKMLLETADMEQYKEYIQREKPTEFALEWFYHKPLKECSLQELIDAMILKIKVQGGFDTLHCTEDDQGYYISMTHNMGINCSLMNILMYESLFNSYGVNFESEYSLRGVFFKVFK